MVPAGNLESNRGCTSRSELGTEVLPIKVRCSIRACKAPDPYSGRQQTSRRMRSDVSQAYGSPYTPICDSSCRTEISRLKGMLTTEHMQLSRKEGLR